MENALGRSESETTNSDVNKYLSSSPILLNESI